MFLGLKEVSIVKFNADKNEKYITSKINEMLKNGWELLHISTMAANNLPSSHGASNFYMYHFGKLKEDNE